jgi:hypothetical protein
MDGEEEDTDSPHILFEREEQLALVEEAWETKRSDKHLHAHELTERTRTEIGQIWSCLPQVEKAFARQLWAPSEKKSVAWRRVQKVRDLQATTFPDGVKGRLIKPPSPCELRHSQKLRKRMAIAGGRQPTTPVRTERGNCWSAGPHGSSASRTVPGVG